jgi:hypothetical protein
VGSGIAADNVTADSILLIDVVRAVLDRCLAQRWVVQPTEAWCHVSPPAETPRQHGWKLHVTATPLAAPLVLARCAEVVVRHGCSFKFGTDIPRVIELVGDRFDRGSGGKFITVYPRDDEQFRVLAEELHRVTRDLPGPGILSDRQLRPGSSVHYRYGEFRGDRVFTDDGVFAARMVGPDGSAFVDERKAWFSPPAWAPPPLVEVATAAPAAPESVLLGGRFRVRQAIRHANKGGVYRAVDERTGDEVIIKQARAHVGAALDGTDVRDRLRTEARMLEVLGPLLVAPAKVDFFAEQGDLFLVEESVPGKPLHTWAAERVAEGGLGLPAAVAMTQRLIALMQSVHEADLVICDFKPQNLMVTPFEEVRLVDVEGVARQGQDGFTLATPGFMAPEVLTAMRRWDRSVPEPTSDCFSLGVTVFCMLTGLTPQWVSGRAGVPRSTADLQRLLLGIGQSHPVVAAFVNLIAGLTETDTDQRWSLKRAQEFLLTAGHEAGSVPVPTRVGRLAPPGALDRLIADGMIHLQRTISPHRSVLWPRNPVFAPDTDACNAWPGAAGTLAVLTRAALALGDESLRDTVTQAAAWIDERLFSVPRLLPGLCTGRSGTAWALHEAAGLLGDDRLASRALELARALPTSGHNASISHGLSGAGMAHLHLWQATGDPAMLRSALGYADAALDAARRTGDDWAWPIPTNANSLLAGINRYGFATGVAGVGAFLLAAAQAAGHDSDSDGPPFLHAALGAGDTLARAVRLDDRRAMWPVDVGGEHGSMELWCKGPAGIGDFLIRLWAATGEQRFADLAEQAANTVVQNPWRTTTGACCGLAGGGQFLLDMADHTGLETYWAHAEDLAAVIYTQHTEHGDLQLTGALNGGHDYADGSAGILDFLLRLRHGGPRLWMPRYEHMSSNPARRP